MEEKAQASGKEVFKWELIYIKGRNGFSDHVAFQLQRLLKGPPTYYEVQWAAGWHWNGGRTVAYIDFVTVE